jgi:hypothetical protein
MPKIASDQVIGAGNIGTFQEHIVIGAGNFKAACRSHRIAVVLDELQQLPAQTLTDFELRRENGPAPKNETTG